MKGVPLGNIEISDTRLKTRIKDNYDYLMSLTNDNLIRNFEYEAGLYQIPAAPEGVHGGWENPYCQLRGHFFGHWLSAAAQHYAATSNAMIKAKADALVDRLAICQIENGGQWAGSIPEKYLHRIAQGKQVWAPQYTLHKTFLGLLDMHEYACNEKALEIAEKWADWFIDWSDSFTDEEFDDILDFETGGMLEIWARMYGFTGKAKHKKLMERYYRGRLFDAMLAGRDVLTNMHANTTIPEVMGAAAAHDATGEKKWLDICMKYWDLAVTQRGSFCTGGQTLGEVWTPKNEQQARLGGKNQEHCTVYNMMRLADYLFKITGEAKYADYYEQNLYNGIFAQGYWHGSHTNGVISKYPDFGLLTYFLPLNAGGRKGWASETQDFFCCHGSLVQANATMRDGLVYSNDDTISLCQYFSMKAECSLADGKAMFEVDIDTLSGQKRSSSTASDSNNIEPITSQVKSDPKVVALYIKMQKTTGKEYTLKIRVPWWIKGEPKVLLNDNEIEADIKDGFISIKRVWSEGDVLYVELSKGLTCWPLADAPNTVAFLDGPVVLAGLVDEERVLYGDTTKPETLIRTDNEREWGMWKGTYHTLNLDNGFKLIPLYEVGYEKYAVYFPVIPK